MARAVLRSCCMNTPATTLMLVSLLSACSSEVVPPTDGADAVDLSSLDFSDDSSDGADDISVMPYGSWTATGIESRDGEIGFLALSPGRNFVLSSSSIPDATKSRLGPFFRGRSTRWFQQGAETFGRYQFASMGTTTFVVLYTDDGQGGELFLPVQYTYDPVGEVPVPNADVHPMLKYLIRDGAVGASSEFTLYKETVQVCDADSDCSEPGYHCEPYKIGHVGWCSYL